MSIFVALLRAVNVGGHGKLAMRDLVTLCGEAGFSKVRTYIASGNAVFTFDGSAQAAKVALEARLLAFCGAPVPVMVREADEMADLWQACPYHDAPGNKVAVAFLDAPPGSEALDDVKGQADEQMAIGAREIYVFYPSGMGASRLRIKAAETGTARNMNTVAKLVAMVRD